MWQRCFAALVVAAMLTGCSGRHEPEDQPLTFEERRDTTGLSAGAPLLTRVEPYREPNDALRVRGRLNLPNGTRVELSIYRGDNPEMVYRLHVIVRNGRFESPPVLPGGKPLSPGRYRFEYFTLFNPAWQTPEVLRATSDGRALRGPGVTRDQAGGAAFFLVEERTL